MILLLGSYTHVKGSFSYVRAANVVMKLEWINDDGSDLLRPKPTLRVDNARQSNTWFKSIVVAHSGQDEQDNFALESEPSHTLMVIHFPLKWCMIASRSWRNESLCLVDNLAVINSFS